MQSRVTNIVIGVIGLVMLLLGILFQVIGLSVGLYIPFTGVGGSILATAIVSTITSMKMRELVFVSIIRALKEATKFVRTSHKLTLELELKDGGVKIKAEHEFAYHNDELYTRSKHMKIYTDAGVNGEGGFSYLKNSEGKIISGDELKSKVKAKYNKVYYEDTYSIAPRETKDFLFATYGMYDLNDRILWAVQDFSDNMEVVIKDFTGIYEESEKYLKIKVNHHNEDEIMKNVHRNHDEVGHDVITFRFDSEILPYQGFEIYWEYKKHIEGKSFVVETR
jgi:hypothetical protein